MIIEEPFKEISSEDMLAQIEIFNKEVRTVIEKDENFVWRRKYVLLGTDVIFLFPSMTAERTVKSVRGQVKKSPMKWKDIDTDWLMLLVLVD